MLKCVGGRGSAPDPAGGAHDAPLDPLVGWGGGHPLPRPETLGSSIPAPVALVFQPDPYHFLKRSGAHAYVWAKLSFQ